MLVLQTRVTVEDMCDVTTEWYLFLKFLARGGYLFLRQYLKLGENFLSLNPKIESSNPQLNH